jgi:hypothetical protein
MLNCNPSKHWSNAMAAITRHLRSTAVSVALMLMVLGSGIAAAADNYRLMLSAREDSGVGKDVFGVSYDSFDDLLNSPPVVDPVRFPASTSARATSLPGGRMTASTG